jgi:hypothetical protein
MIITKFEKFRDALEHLERESLAGKQGIYFPRGGDKPGSWTTEPAQHIVVVVEMKGN